MTNTQQNAAKPATELAFPSVTICSSGLNMEAVMEAIAKDFKEWKEEEGKFKEDIDLFMETKYAMKVGGENIFEKIRAMTLPPVGEESTDSITLAENLITCKGNSMSDRRKSINIIQNTIDKINVQDPSSLGTGSAF